MIIFFPFKINVETELSSLNAKIEYFIVHGAYIRHKNHLTKWIGSLKMYDF